MIRADDRGVGGKQEQARRGQNHGKLDAQAADDQPELEMKLSLSVALICSGSRPIDSAVRTGEVTTMVSITASIAQRVVRRRGKRMVGTQLADAFQTGKSQPRRGKTDQKLIV